jgi:hypothetical protein
MNPEAIKAEELDYEKSLKDLEELQAKVGVLLTLEIAVSNQSFTNFG